MTRLLASLINPLAYLINRLLDVVDPSHWADVTDDPEDGGDLG